MWPFGPRPSAGPISQRRRGPAARRQQPRVELLEDRLVPTSLDLAWVQQLGGAGDSLATTKVAVAGDGSIYSVGTISGMLPGQTSAGGQDAFLIKQSATGSLVWAKQFGSANFDQATNVAIDGQGNIVVVGITSGTLPGQTSAGGVDLFVAQYKADGTLNWLKQFGTSDDDSVSGLAIDGQGNIDLGGSVAYSAWAGQTRSGTQDAFVLQLTSTGSLAWARQFGDHSTAEVNGLAVDAQGNIYAVGDGNAALDGQTGLGGFDAFVRKFDHTGATQWTQQIGTSHWDFGNAIAVDGQGNVYVTGQTQGAFAGQVSAGDYDGYLLQLTAASGHVNWARQFGSSAADDAYGLATDAAGNVDVVGYTYGALPGQTNAGGSDAFLIQYSGTGTQNYVKEFGTSHYELALGVAVNSAGSVLVLGNTTGAFAGQTSAGPQDLFIAQFNTQLAATTTNLTSRGSVSLGQAATFTATVTGAGKPTGTVTFKEGTTVLGSGTLDTTDHVSLVFTFTTTGNHSVTAVYGGDSSFAGSSSSLFTQTVTLPTTTTTLAASKTATVIGQTVTFTATVASASGTPGGSVTFKDGTTVLGSVALDASGKATLVTTFTTAGTHSIAVTYAGNTTFIASNSATLGEVVALPTTTTALAASTASSLVGQAVTFTATVASANGTPTGTVVFKDGTATVGTATLSGGMASIVVTFTTGGTHSISAIYAGNAVFATSTSAVRSEAVTVPATTTALAASTASALVGQAVTFTATVASASGTPTGTVIFKDGTATLGTATLGGGKATFVVDFTTGGTHSITAVYAGSAAFATSTSTARTEAVTVPATTTALADSASSSFVGQAVTFTATVTSTGGTPTGTVIFKDGTATLGTASLSGGKASLVVKFTTGGSHSITAVYAGIAAFATSTSAAQSEAVTVPATTTGLTSSLASATIGQAVTFMATVTSVNGTPTGSVVFKDGTATLGTVSLSGGTASLVVKFTTGGSHSITAVFAGNASFTTSSSTAQSESITLPGTTTALTASLASSTVGQAVTLTATVASTSGTPAGMVTFLDGTTSLGTATLTSGKAAFVITFTTAATHSLTATYAGSAGFLASTSATFTQTVSAAATDVPGSSITATLRSTASGLTLVIDGTNGDDNILVTQSGSSLILTTPAGKQTFTPPAGQSITGILVNGFDGNDQIRLDASIVATISAIIYAGNGNDTLIDNGADSAALHAGSGTDTLITVGGGSDYLYGGAGLDSFWYDSTDHVSGTTAAETAAQTLHQITAFTTPTGSSSVPLSIAGQTLSEPGSAFVYSNQFANHPLFAGTPQFNDIVQGDLGDCYYLAALSALAQTNPTSIEQSITALGDGTYAVRFFKSDGSAVYFRIDAELPTSGNSPVYADLTRNGQALWVPLLEKAFAEFRTGADTYASIESGWMAEGYMAITGSSDSWFSTAASDATVGQQMLNALNAGKAVTASSISDSTGMIIGDHAYEVHSVEYDAATGTWYVTVYNPWGIDGVTYDSNANDGLLRLTMADFEAHFDYVDMVK